MDDKRITKHIFQRLAVILLGFRAVALVSIHDAVHLIEFNSVVGILTRSAIRCATPRASACWRRLVQLEQSDVLSRLGPPQVGQT